MFFVFGYVCLLKTNCFVGFETSKIQLGNRLLRLGLLNKRLLGLSLICEVADGARAANRREQIGQVCLVANWFLFLGGGSFVLNKKKQADKPADQWMTCEHLASWMVENRLLEYLYGDGVHAELLARCASSVPGTLAEVGLLTEEQIDLIWKAAIGQHESILTEVYKAFPVIAGFVSRAGQCKLKKEYEFF